MERAGGNRVAPGFPPFPPLPPVSHYALATAPWRHRDREIADPLWVRPPRPHSPACRQWARRLYPLGAPTATRRGRRAPLAPSPLTARLLPPPFQGGEKTSPPPRSAAALSGRPPDGGEGVDRPLRRQPRPPRASWPTLGSVRRVWPLTPGAPLCAHAGISTAWGGCRGGWPRRMSPRGASAPAPAQTAAGGGGFPRGGA